MFANRLEQLITAHPDFPRKGIIFRDLLPILSDPNIFSELIDNMCSPSFCKEADAVLSIDARGFIFGTAIAMKLSKPMILARKAGKLPGELIEKPYSLEYGESSLSIQKSCLKKYQSFLMVDDLLATGGTVKCISEILSESKKDICGLCVVIELGSFEAKSKLSFPVSSQITY